MEQNPPATPQVEATQEIAAPPKASSKRRFKPLLILLAIGLILLGIAGYQRIKAAHDGQVTDRIQKELKAEGVDVYYAEGEPEETELLALQPGTLRVVHVRPQHPQVTEANLDKICGINQRINLLLGGTEMNDSLLSKLAGKPNIRWLQLAGTPITDEGIKYLAGMDLESLDLSRTKITDAGAEALGKMKFPHLKDLSFDRTKVTDACLPHLDHFTNLEFLTVSDTKVTKGAAKRLKVKLPDLTITF